MSEEKLLLTIREAADLLGIGRTKAQELVSTEQIKSVQIGKLRRVSRRAILTYVEELEGDNS